MWRRSAQERGDSRKTPGLGVSARASVECEEQESG